MENEKKDNLTGDEQGKQGMDTSRRSFTRIGVGAPVLMTLASQPVFGAQCLSNMLSGNLSDPDRGNCDFGWSPGGWCNPVGKVAGMSTISAWASTGFPYGGLDVAGSGCTGVGGGGGGGGQPGNNPACYTGGATVADLNTVISGLAYPVGIIAAPITGSAPASTTLLELVCDSHKTYGPHVRHCVTAFLNASLPSITYILTQAQVVGICSGQLPLPDGHGSINGFLDTTWV